MQTIPYFGDVKVELLGASPRASRRDDISVQSDDLSRNVYCVLGIPVDAIDMAALLRAVEEAAAVKAPFLISTPNLNFLVNSLLDAEFRESVLLSELCPVDGMPIIWIARLLGLPIKDRVAGSDMFEAFRSRDNCAQPLTIFLFGGAEGVVEAAAKALKARPGGLNCVGFIYPGFGSIEDMSQDHIINEINISGADFLMVALGAQKGQLWLKRNHDRLRIPVRAHLGATINFAAGNVRRAPAAARKFGLEWLWRIKEEPHLWKRYWNDGVTLLGLLFTHILPLAIVMRWERLRRPAQQDLVIESTQDYDTISLSLCGAATARNAEKATSIFREALATKKKIVINLSNTCVIDPRFLGLLLMLRKQANRQDADVKFIGASSWLGTMFRLNGVGYLLALDRSA
jgi:N-acetylglucosaminyldiphosphoundecaprenol N-acetyl-beta-D-mannosaminyltransferase